MPADNLPTVKRLSEISIEYQDKASKLENTLVNAAEAESEYRQRRAQRALVARAEEKASAAFAEMIADADPVVAALCMNYKVTAAIADAARSKLTQLRAQLDFGKAKLYADLGTDKIHAAGLSGAA